MESPNTVTVPLFAAFGEIDELNAKAWPLNRKEPRAAIELAEKALALSEKNNYIPGKAAALKTLGASNVWISNSEKGLDYSFQALQLFKDLFQPIDLGDVCYAIFANFYIVADYDNAIKYAQMCSDFHRQGGNEQGIAAGLNGQGTAYYTMGNNEKALECLLEALPIAEKYHDIVLLPKILDGLGNSYKNLGNHDKALEYMFKCLDLLKDSIHDRQVEAFALDCIGDIYSDKKDYRNATEYFNKALVLWEELGFRNGQAGTLTNLGELYFNNVQYEKAIEVLSRAIHIGEDAKAREPLFKATGILSEIYEKLGNASLAIQYLKKHHITGQEITRDKAERRNKSVELQHKIEQAENEKKLLKEKNRELESFYRDVVMLSEIGQKITSCLTVEAINKTIYDAINTMMDAPSFGIGIYDAGRNVVHFPGYLEDGQLLQGGVYDLSNNNRLAPLCFNQEKEILINDFFSEINNFVTTVLQPVAGRNVTSIIYLPLKVKEKKIGVITVQSFKKNAYTPYHVNILRSLGAYAAIAIDNATLYSNMEEEVKQRTAEVIKQKEQIERSFENTRLLSEIGQQLTSTLKFENIFSKLHENVNNMMDATCFGVRIYEPEKNVVVYKYEMEKGIKDIVVEVPLTDDDNYTVWCIKNKKEIFINDNLNEYSRYVKQIRVPTGEMSHSLIFYPMMVGERVLGVITVQSFERNAYTPYHLEILKSLASYTAIALDNANLYENLEVKVQERTSEVMRQKEIIEEKNKDITDSIKYAEKIQKAILPGENEIKKLFPESFVLYNPKDIVSGDFYWHGQVDHVSVFAVADCTGHGVPGALMSAICNNLLNQVVLDRNISSPAEALYEIDLKLKQLLGQNSGDTGTNDGMDIALCGLNTQTNELSFAGAYRPLIIIRGEEVIEVKPDKHSIGGNTTSDKSFTNHKISMQPNDMVYIFTDGFADQFGGPKGKKFKYDQLKKLLLELQEKSVEEQKQVLHTAFVGWRGELEQIDDVCVMGVKLAV